MRRWIIPICIILVAFALPELKHKPDAPAANSFAVIELFTSEGCSSCPPADAVVAKANKDFAGKVYVLGFHVDYWNQLGWRDQFSSASWTNRQKHYAELLNVNSIYTPQIVVNGKKELVGSDEEVLKNIIEYELKMEPPVNITLNAQNSKEKTISVAWTLSKENNAVLNIALVQLQATTEVKKGENQNRTLSHINIVRELKSVRNAKTTGTTELSLPSGAEANNFAIIAYLQDKDNWQVLGAVETNITSKIH
jgi:hypothetical protein